MLKYFFISITLFLAQTSLAYVPVDGKIAVCNPYPTIENNIFKPLKFNTTNNLSRPINSAFYEAEGEKIILYGRIMDSNCTPLNDAKIYIWQNNKKGYIQYTLKDQPKDPMHPKWTDPNFTGTGISNSDNLGRFNFITIKPGSSNKTTPHINIIVEHRGLKTLESKIYFLNNLKGPIRDIDNDGKEFSLKDRNLIAQVTAVPGGEAPNNKGNVYFIDITLDEAIDNKLY